MFNLKSSIFFASFCIVLCSSLSLREKRQALSYTLPDGVELYLTKTSSSFVCQKGGYYADIEANCQLFHICLPQEFPDGKRQMSQFTFACGNQTVFNQFSMTCVHESDSIPCASSTEFFYLNDRIGQVKTDFHNDEDIVRLSSVIKPTKA